VDLRREASLSSRRLGTFAAILAIAVMAQCAVASAEEAGPSRVEYVKQLEDVCRPEAEATQRAMKHARMDVRESKLSVAAAKFDKAAKIFGGTVDQISKVPQPSADKSRLTEWFGYLEQQTEYLKEIGMQLHKGKTIKAQRLFPRFIHNGNLANNEVLAFGFNYCNFEFSRYG
jgi:hypothetical protein